MSDTNQNQQDNSIINSLKRLERAGSKSSRATEKLREAASTVAQKIVSLCEHAKEPDLPLTLPRGYQILQVCSNVSSELYLYAKPTHDYEHDGTLDVLETHYQHGDFNAKVRAASRTQILKFAEDIASGLLDEIATWLEARTGKSVQAQRELEYGSGKSDNNAGLPNVAGEPGF